MNSSRFLLAIPVFNEEQYVTGVLDEAREYVRDILVVDDGSTDATPDLLRKTSDIQVITHPENRGYGMSLADAFAYAIGHRYEWLITMDCDEQHEAAQIPLFIDRAAENDADILSGTRYPAGRDIPDNVPEDRLAINRYITQMLNDRLGIGITDAFCGFKAYRVCGLKCFDISVPGYAMPMQLWVQAARAGLKIAEVPVKLIYEDPTRHFGGILDDPDERLQHYLAVLEEALTETPVTPRNQGPCADEPVFEHARNKQRGSRRPGSNGGRMPCR